ncbi:MAG: DNA repair protein RadA, partial [Rhodospirillales bacterium]|nr:DNA repair protein RadA [Rhodospirillales bacterium]
TFFGEVGLSGEIRPVTHSDVRLKEAEKLGFSTVVMPPRRKRAKKDIQNTSLNVVEIDHLADLVARFGSSEMGVPKAPQSQNNSQEQEN